MVIAGLHQPFMADGHWNVVLAIALMVLIASYISLLWLMVIETDIHRSRLLAVHRVTSAVLSWWSLKLNDHSLITVSVTLHQLFKADGHWNNATCPHGPPRNRYISCLRLMVIETDVGCSMDEIAQRVTSAIKGWWSLKLPAWGLPASRRALHQP